MKRRPEGYEADPDLYEAVIEERIYAVQYITAEEWNELEKQNELINVRLQILAERWKLL